MPTQTILSMPSSQWALLGSHRLTEALSTDHSACPLPPTPTAPVGTAPHPQGGRPHSGLRNFPCWLEASPCSHHSSWPLPMGLLHLPRPAAAVLLK